jgi:large subunit ribosomal protein L4
MYRGAMRSILSELVRQDRLVVVDEFSTESHKTKEVAIQLNSLELSNVIIVVEEISENLYLGARNLKNVEVVDVSSINPVNLMGYEKALFTVAALKKAEESLG